MSYVREVSSKDEKNTLFIVDPVDQNSSLESICEQIKDKCLAGKVKPEIYTDMYFDDISEDILEAIFVRVNLQKTDIVRDILLPFGGNHHDIWVD